jgi:hypothetical protein
MLDLERIFTPKALIALNLLLIATAQATGHLFHDTGLVHIVAILFIALSVTRIFQNYHLYDPFIKRFVNAALISLLFFSGSHAIEFIGIVVLKLPPQTALVNVFAVYVVSILFLILGVQFVLRKTRHQSQPYSWILIALLTCLITSIVYVMVKPDAAFGSASAPSVALSLFGISLVLITIFQIIGFFKIRKILPTLGKMQNYLILSSVFILLSAIPNMLFELRGAAWGLAPHQAVYLSHYAFYAAASALFLSFGTLSSMGGLYEDVREEDRKAQSTAN